MAEVDGATLIARNLKKQGVQYMFGIVGFPVQPIALSLLLTVALYPLASLLLTRVHNQVPRLLHAA